MESMDAYPIEELQPVLETAEKPRVGDGTPGPGRPKGLQNRMTRELKEMILEALDAAGGVAYLKSKAETHPGPFLALVGKVLPMTVQGDPDAPLGLNIKVTFPEEPPL